jgi:leucyl-tRNA synthetase
MRIARPGAALPNAMSVDAIALRKATHRALAAVDDSLRALRFNVAVARIYELTNAITGALSVLAEQRPDTVDFSLGAAIREALDLLIEMVAPMMPHLAEECFAALGHPELVSTRPWPEIERSLLVEETITLPVQVNGKKRGELTIPVGASEAEVEAAVLALDAVRRALDGHAPKKIVVVPKRIVNVVL